MSSPFARDAGPHAAPTRLLVLSEEPVDSARLIEAGHTAERSGHRQEARSLFEAALHRLAGDDAGTQSASLLRWIARTYMTDANFDAAMDCAIAALAISEAHDDAGGRGHAINVQAAIHWAQGDLDEAERLFLVARTSALAAGEGALAAMTSHNLGIIANIRGEFAEALHHYSVGLEHYRALGRSVHVAEALNNMGRLHTDLRQWSDAERAYAEAVEISDAVGDRTARIGIEVNRAEMWLVSGNAARAAQALTDALRLSETSHESAWLAQISKLRGIERRDAGAPVEAERYFADAVEGAEARQNQLLLAETLRERAVLYRGQGRNREALQNLNRAHRIFTQLRAKRELANVDRSVAQLEDDFINVVRRWGESIEAKDRYTQGHCVRVADLACAIASACGIDEQSLFWFRIGALLHDVGKLVVPSEVLNKPGKLTDDEWALMRSHTTAGVDMLAGIDFPWDVRPIIESHHERWDGKGYPHGLRGDEIPLSARILAVADVYDALTSIRSYKDAIGHEAAIEIMRRDAGTAFDPEVFRRFEQVVGTGLGPSAVFNKGSAITRSTTERPEGGARHNLHALPASDPLDELPGRPSIERIAEQALADAAMANGCVSLVVVQVGTDRAVRSTGRESRRHRALVRIARELRAHTRVTDFVARTGDDQFMVLLPGSPAPHAAWVVQRVESAVTRGLLRGAASRDTLRIRTAIVVAPDDGETAEQLLASADAAIASPRVTNTGLRRARGR